MKVYTVHYQYHYDDYKRSETSSGVLNVFKNKDNAYNYALKQNKEILEDYAKYRFNCINCEEHVYIENENDNNSGYCDWCSITLIKNKDGSIGIDLTDEDNIFSKEHLNKIFNDSALSVIDKYNFIHENFNVIFPKPEFTMQPTHRIYFVSELELL